MAPSQQLHTERKACRAPYRHGACYKKRVRYERSLKERTFSLGLAILKLYPTIAAFGLPYRDIALQLTRAATSIGSQLEEGEVAASRRDMAAKT